MWFIISNYGMPAYIDDYYRAQSQAKLSDHPGSVRLWPMLNGMSPVIQPKVSHYPKIKKKMKYMLNLKKFCKL